MNGPDPYHDPAAVRALAETIRREAARLRDPVTIMEVCGSHTHAIARAGLRSVLPENLRLISGPGCPVCVTPVDWLDRAVALARREDVILATFGDLMRVPSSGPTLEAVRSEGAPVEIVYSPRDALELARAHPDRRVVFLAVGFETTAPTIAAALVEAEREGLPNFSILPGNKTMPRPMELIAADPGIGVDGFLLPGHVSVITGSDCFGFLAAEYGLPGTVVGFTPVDVLRGVLEIVRQRLRGQARVVNLYGRVVTPGGNAAARRLLEQVFVPAPATWRGLGEIPDSGLDPAPAWSHRDARTLEVDLPEPREPEGCRCGEVLKGLIDPPQCPLFDTVCTPEDPVGACMVSSEGSCAAWHRHERLAAAGRPA